MPNIINLNPQNRMVSGSRQCINTIIYTSITNHLPPIKLCFYSAPLKYRKSGIFIIERPCVVF